MLVRLLMQADLYEVHVVSTVRSTDGFLMNEHDETDETSKYEGNTPKGGTVLSLQHFTSVCKLS